MKRFILFFLLIFSVNSFSQKQIPSIDLLDFQGEKINTTDLLNNEKLTILSLWATWCVPCIIELDAINEVYEFWKEDIDFEEWMKYAGGSKRQFTVRSQTDCELLTLSVDHL